MMRKKRAGAGILTVLLAFLPILLCSGVPVQAAAGTVYSCTMNRCYSHPVTGVIEDAGGEASYATGQGMAEGAVYGTGIMEVTAEGAYYLTFRISLVDYTSNQSFFVQNVGDSGWSAVTPTVTAKGSDSNGTTSDLCIQVPSENCIVKSSMYVTPMGRDVVFYFYPSNYTQGNSTDMTAAVVTESTGDQTNVAQADTDGTKQTGTKQSASEAQSGDSLTEAETMQTAAAEANNQVTGSMGEAAAPAAENASDAELNSAQGLSLSTAEEEAAETESTENSIGVVSLIVAVTVSVTISGLILMTAAAGIVCYFRKNWRRWGGYDDEDYDDEDE